MATVVREAQRGVSRIHPLGRTVTSTTVRLDVDTIGEGAILVKLMRVALLVPAVLLYAQIFRSEHSAAADETGRDGRPPLLPGFLVGFMALVAANSFGIVPPGLAEALSDASRWCLVVAIAALGVKTSLGQLLTLGWAPITMMVAETVFIALVVLGGVMLLG